MRTDNSIGRMVRRLPHGTIISVNRGVRRHVRQAPRLVEHPMQVRSFAVIGFWVVVLGQTPVNGAETLLPGFARTEQFDEQVRWTRLPSGVRVFVDAPVRLQAAKRRLVIFATPNGNTLEQTLGCAADKDIDCRFDIQHVAAQIRRLREITPDEDILLVVVQAPQLSWPAFRQQQAEAGEIIRDLVANLIREFAADRVDLTCHSGGGSFVHGWIEAVDAIPGTIARIAFLDANYSYSDQKHADKLLAWLNGSPSRRLIVIAYDDREITFNGKKVVGPDGGTFRATERLLARIRKDFPLTEAELGLFRRTTALDGQVQVFVHPNPESKILHTALVGEMNGLLQSLTVAGPQENAWGQFGGPRAYTAWVQAAPFAESKPPAAVVASDVPERSLPLPPRPADAVTGSEFYRRVADLDRVSRETAVVREITHGNVPEFLRRLVPIRVAATDATGQSHSAVYYVMSDYLAVGSDADFFRLPLTPYTGSLLADKLQASLITTKISDDIFAAAIRNAPPRPLTENRDAVATFFEHHRLIEKQFAGQPPGPLTAGIKKDVVLSNRLREKPHKVAIYGWHQPDGLPIQSLYVGHVDWYLDYSHGVRLMGRQMVVDGETRDVIDVLKDPRLHGLVSSEGMVNIGEVRTVAAWRP